MSYSLRLELTGDSRPSYPAKLRNKRRNFSLYRQQLHSKLTTSQTKHHYIFYWINNFAPATLFNSKEWSDTSNAELEITIIDNILLLHKDPRRCAPGSNQRQRQFPTWRKLHDLLKRSKTLQTQNTVVQPLDETVRGQRDHARHTIRPPVNTCSPPWDVL